FLSLTYNYGGSGGNNGNVQGQTIGRPNGNWTQGYTYDSLNRLTGATESGSGSWAEGYVYDGLGNRWLCMPSQGCGPARAGLPDLTGEAPTTQSWYNGNNQLNGWTYDQAGNILQVANMARSFTYDAENRQVTASVAGIANAYSYDGEGRRVMRTTPWNAAAPTTVYVYDAFGQLAAEYGQATESSGTKYLTV